MSRRWVKLWTKECLSGTIRFEFTPEERGVWYDLLILAGDCRQDGTIAAGNGVPYPHTWIAGTLNIPLKLLERVLKKCEQTDRIREDNNGIHIVNWVKYQSEYERQKPYRDRRKENDPDKSSGLDEYDKQINALEQQLKSDKLLPWQRKRITDEIKKIRHSDPNRFVKGEYSHMVKR